MVVVLEMEETPGMEVMLEMEVMMEEMAHILAIVEKVVMADWHQGKMMAKKVIQEDVGRQKVAMAD